MSRHSFTAHSFFSFMILVCLSICLALTTFLLSAIAESPQSSLFGEETNTLWNVIIFWAAKTFGSLAPMHAHSFRTPANTIPENSTNVTISSRPRDHAAILRNIRRSHALGSLKGSYSDDQSTRTVNGHPI